MSASESPGRREVAYRVFAAEYDDATHSYSESDEERAPSYVVTPTGARANRLFVVGVLTAVEQAGESNLRARVVDPTGAFVVYAGQYEPEALSTLQRLEVPTYVAVTGKARTFESSDGERVFSTIRPESITEVDEDTRDRWVLRTAEHTLARIDTFADALDRPERGVDLRRALLEDGVDPGVAAGIPRAISAYGTSPAYLAGVRSLVLDAVRVIADERDAVRPFDVAPDEGDGTEASVDIDVTEIGITPGPVTEAGEADVPQEAVIHDEPTGQAEESAPAEPGEEVASTPPPSAPAPETAPADEEPADSKDVTPTPGSDAEAASPAESSDEGAEEFDLPDEEREQVKEEFGVEFSSGNDIPDAGEADIETPEPDPESESEPEPETGDTEPPAAEDESAPETTVSLEDAVIEAMRDLANGGAADRAALIDRVTTNRGVDESAVEDAIQDALMSGRCYESDDDELTPI